VQKDEAIGAAWLAVAARQGNPVAQNRLARIYFKGRGVERDPVEAAKWHLLASEAGRPDAELDTLVAELGDAERQEARARADRFTAEAAEKQASTGTSPQQ
jgi:TPR repeat protein